MTPTTVTNHGGFVAGQVAVSLRLNPGRADVLYVVDDAPQQRISIAYPDDLHVDAVPGAAALLAASAAIYLGSLCLAGRIDIDRPLPHGLATDLHPLTQMLYDVRCWKDDLPLVDAPVLRSPTGRTAAPTAPPLDPSRSLVPWSGGKDSTLALLTLRANGREARPVHVTVNAGVEGYELEATRVLAELLGIPAPPVIDYGHAEFLGLSGAHAVDWDRFPLCNRVPFGRDLLLAAMLVPYAVHLRAAWLSFGHDNECRTSTVEHHGRVIPRNDLESAEGAAVLERAIRTHVHPGLGLLPPLANLSEMRILRDMFSLHPELMARSAFCFWGGRCGRCAKCLRYFLADRLYGTGLLRFDVNPLSAGACPELDDVLSPAPRSTLFQREVLTMLGRVAQRDGDRCGEDVLTAFASSVLPGIAGELDAWELDLLAVRRDPQVPDGLRPYSDCRTQ